MSAFDNINFGVDPGAGSDASNVDNPAISSDDLNVLLQSLNYKPTPFNSMILADNGPGVANTVVRGASSAPANTAGGVARVNADTSKTGVVAYRDSKGQVNLTNVAKDATTGQETPIVPGASLNSPGGNNGSANLLGGVAQKITSPLPIASLLNQLSATTDSGAARALFESFQEAATTQQVKIQQDATNIASAKLGIPGLEQQLNQAMAADRSDPAWVPGIGDSPITAKIRTELDVARGYAATQAKEYLTNNLNYNLLNNQVKQASSELARVQKLTDRKDLVADNISLRSAERNAQKQDDLEQKAQGMSQETIARIQALQAQDFSDPSVDPRTKAYQLFANSKDKDFQVAVGAQGDQLPILAIKGNKYAVQLVAQSESNITGATQDQVKMDIANLQRTIQNPQLLKQMIAAKYPNNPKAAEAEFGNMNAALKSSDPNKKIEATDARINMAIDLVKLKKTQNFMNDVNTWGSTDPDLLAAATKAFQTTGKRNFDNTLAAYLGDSTGPDMLKKLSVFKQLTKTAALKNQGSVFGVPDYHATDGIINKYAAGSSIFQSFLQKARLNGDNAMMGLLGNVNIAGQAVIGAANNIMKTFKGNPAGIDPATGLPFDQAE